MTTMSETLKPQALNTKGLVDPNYFDYSKYEEPKPRRDLTPQPKSSQQISHIISKCNLVHNTLRELARREGREVRREWEAVEEMGEKTLRQIEVARERVYMELC